MEASFYVVTHHAYASVIAWSLKTKALRSTGNGDTLFKPQRSLSASDATQIVLSPEGQLNLPGSLSLQNETLRLNGQTTIHLVEKLLVMITTLTAEVTHLTTLS
jgi:hypothetical protein